MVRDVYDFAAGRPHRFGAGRPREGTNGVSVEHG
jgi:hypothetical protein